MKPGPTRRYHGAMEPREAADDWDANAEVWTTLIQAGYDTYRDAVNTPAFFAGLPDVAGLCGLDIGCGEGHNTRLLARCDARVTAIDIPEWFIEHARSAEAEEPLDIDCRLADACDPPFKDEAFDFATAFMSLIDIPTPERAMFATVGK